MMRPDAFSRVIMTPGLARLQEVGGIAAPADARRFLLAVVLQESGLSHRYQVGSAARYPGPARGWWQFERGGGVVGVMTHVATKSAAARMCDDYAVEFDSYAIWRALEGHDQLATAFARLLLWADPNALPTTPEAGWACYLRQWRPGKPHPATWPAHWAAATAVTP